MPQVGSEKLIRFYRQTKLTSFGVVLLFLLVSVVTVFALYSPYSPVNLHDRAAIFEVDGKTYDRGEVTALIDVPVSRGVTKQEATDKAFEMMKNRAAADKLGIPVSNNELAAAKIIFSSQKGSNGQASKWQEALAYDSVIKTKLSDGYVGSRKGYAFIFGFGDHILKFSEFTPEKFGDKTAIEADKSAAMVQAKEYLALAKNGKVTPAQLADKLKTDSGSGNKNVYSTSYPLAYSGDSEPILIEQLASTSILGEVMASTGKAVSEIKVGSVSQEDVPNPYQLNPEVYYYFVWPDQVSKQQTVTNDSFQKTVAGLRTKLYKDRI